MLTFQSQQYVPTFLVSSSWKAIPFQSRPLGDSVSHAGEDDKKVECFSLVILSLQAGRGLRFFIVAKVGLLSPVCFNPNGSSLNLLSLVMIPSICLLGAVW